MSRDIRQIMREDAKRRNARQAQEDALIEAINGKPHSRESLECASMDRKYLRGIGMVLPPNKPGDPYSRKPRMRAVGLAPGTTDTSQGATVAITKNGKTTIVTVASLRGSRSAGRVSKTPTVVSGAENQNQKNHTLTAANLAPIGDSNH